MDDREYQEWLNTRQGKWATWIGVPAGFIVSGLIIVAMGWLVVKVVSWMF